MWLGMGFGSGCAEDAGGSIDDSPTPEIQETPVPGVNLEGPFPYDTLSEYHFFQGDMKGLEPVPGVIPYEVRSPLYTDNAIKPRFIVIPEEGQIDFDADAPWTWPEGTILIKNFMFEHDFRDPSQGYELIETRLLILEEGIWVPHTYLWNEEQTEAIRYSIGTFVTVSFTDLEGMLQEQLYQVPNTNQCRNCHANADAVAPIGPRTRQLNFDVTTQEGTVNQLEHLQVLGMFSSELPSVESLPALTDPRGAADLDFRARSYLEANCAHCHTPGGAASASGLVLSIDETDPYRFGVCKTPVATGTASGDLLYDIVPGASDESILVHRMSSTDPEIKMPELGTLTVDEHGLELIRDWIDAMDPTDYASLCE